MKSPALTNCKLSPDFGKRLECSSKISWLSECNGLDSINSLLSTCHEDSSPLKKISGFLFCLTRNVITSSLRERSCAKKKPSYFKKAFVEEAKKTFFSQFVQRWTIWCSKSKEFNVGFFSFKFATFEPTIWLKLYFFDRLLYVEKSWRIEASQSSSKDTTFELSSSTSLPEIASAVGIKSKVIKREKNIPIKQGKALEVEFISIKNNRNINNEKIKIKKKNGKIIWQKYSKKETWMVVSKRNRIERA